jgi:hypothetical protein
VWRKNERRLRSWRHQSQTGKIKKRRTGAETGNTEVKVTFEDGTERLPPNEGDLLPTYAA